MNPKSFSRQLPSAAASQSIYEAIKLHDQHPAGLNDEDLDDAQIDHDNLEARFQDQDLDTLLAEEGQSALVHDYASNHELHASLKTTQDRRITGDASELPDWTNDHEASPQTRAEVNDVPASLLMEERRSESPPNALKQSPKSSGGRPSSSSNRTQPRSAEQTPRQRDDVPASLLFSEYAHTNDAEMIRRLPPRPSDILPTPVPGPLSSRPRVHWDEGAESRGRSTSKDVRQRNNYLQTSIGPIVTDPADRAMWMWANVDNLDTFLAEVYEYFRGKGIWSILLSRAFEQLTLAFVVGLTVFLTSCVDYRKLPGSKHMSQIMIPRCTSKLSGLSNLFLFFLTFYWLFKTFRIIVHIKQYWSMHEFFTHVLHITENELQTITWQTIVSRLMNLRDANARTALEIHPRTRKYLGEYSKQRMDAHDIANRLMRRDNYLIALFNKDVLDLTLPVPILNSRQFFSRNLEWFINLCVLDYVFNHTGQISQLFLRDSHRHELIEGLRRRFIIMGFISIVSAPFLVTYFLTIYFLRYFTEFQKNPSQIGSRSYTPLAEWKFREFNELYSFFERRLNMSRPFANRYLDQFPKDRISQTARFVAFISGSLASVLGAASLLDPDVFLGFEITPERTVLFYLGVFGTVWAVARGMVADEEDNVFDPEYAISNVAEYTRYMPGHWHGRLHTEEVRKEFAQLYQMKIMIFLEEILSIVITPFVLWFSLPDCSARIVDFFREFTVHVDGLGYVCSFALFEFQKDGVQPNNRAGVPGPSSVAPKDRAEEQRKARQDDLRAGHFASKDNKMLSSYYSFIDSYAHNPTGKAFNRHHDKRIFRPPPSFPSIHEEGNGASMQLPGGETLGRRKPHRSTPSASRQLQPRKNLLDQSAPGPSMLLDPVHQPSTTTRSVGGVMESVALHEDEELGDSWRTMKDPDDGAIHTRHRPRAGLAVTEADEDDKGDAGVLGLLYEFQKAQTDGRPRPGVGV